MIRRKRLLIAAAGVVVGLATLAAFLSRDDWNWARPAVEWAASRSLGREVEIDGDLRVDLGSSTAVEVGRLRVGNADWAKAPSMAAVESLGLRLRILPLLVGRVRLERLSAEGAEIELERRANGTGNWQFGDGDSAGSPALPADVELHDVDLALVDANRPRPFALHVSELSSSERGPLRVYRGEGVYQDEALRVRAVSWGVPLTNEGVTPVRFEAIAGESSLSGDGWLGDGTTDEAFSLAIHAEGESLDDIWRTIGFPLPHSPPFALSGRLSYGGDRVRLARFAGSLGRSDVAGDLTVELPRGRRMLIDADVRSRAIDLDDIEGFWGRAPREEEVARPAATPASAKSIFPDLRFELAKLRVADARLRFVADRVQGRTVLDGVRLDATLQDGVLSLRPLEVGLSAGELTVSGEVDARSAEPRLRADLVLRRVRLEELLRRAGASGDQRDAGGEFGGRAELRSHGKSLRELARNADGEVGAVLQEGWIGDPALELVALHLGGYIRAKLDEGRPGPIRCLVGVFEARQGVLEARTLLLDTEHVRIEGEGEIDLGKETMDLELVQHAKHLTFGALKTPIEIVGPLATRTARLEPGPLVVRGGAAVVLGAIHPLAALLALVDPGRDDKPGACAAALAEYRPIGAGIAATSPPSSREGESGGGPSR